MSNYAVNDKDVVKVNNPEAAKGTSLAAMSNLVWTLKAYKESSNLTPAQVNAAFKMAAIINSNNHQDPNFGTALDFAAKIKSISDSLLLDGKNTPEQVMQAFWLAEGINTAADLLKEEVFKQLETISSAPDEPIAALWVTGITVTTLNGIAATATITPAIEGVTVQYTVTTTGGKTYHGSLKTDASGRASFSVPPGECEEWYTYTVTAVFSSKTATTRFMFYYE
jgi:hypothetical protein